MKYKIIDISSGKELKDKNLRKIRFNPFSGLLTDAKNVPLPNQDNYQILRYIGLNDSANSPICEGDVVDLDSVSYIVIWEDTLCAFVLRHLNTPSIFETFCDISSAKLTITMSVAEVETD